MRNAATALATVVLLLGGAAGCGEKDEPETTGPVVPVTDATTASTDSTTTTSTTGTNASGTRLTLSAPLAVQGFLSSPDSALVCDEVITPALLRKAYGDRAGCLAARKPASLSDPDSKLEVGPEGPDGTRVDAEPKGGLYDGEKLTFTVIQDGDAYRVDSIDSNVPVGP